jgi:hypothetical protein
MSEQCINSIKKCCAGGKQDGMIDTSQCSSKYASSTCSGDVNDNLVSCLASGGAECTDANAVNSAIDACIHNGGGGGGGKCLSEQRSAMNGYIQSCCEQGNNAQECCNTFHQTVDDSCDCSNTTCDSQPQPSDKESKECHFSRNRGECMFVGGECEIDHCMSQGVRCYENSSDCNAQINCLAKPNFETKVTDNSYCKTGVKPSPKKKPTPTYFVPPPKKKPTHAQNIPGDNHGGGGGGGGGGGDVGESKKLTTGEIIAIVGGGLLLIAMIVMLVIKRRKH